MYETRTNQQFSRPDREFGPAQVVNSGENFLRGPRAGVSGARFYCEADEHPDMVPERACR